MALDELRQRIESKTARVAVIGLGYVGFPVACEFARAGFDVLGVDTQVERLSKIQQGLSPIVGMEPGLQELASQVILTGRLQVTADYERLTDRDVILICVETPVGAHHLPDYKALRSALMGLGQVMPSGALVVIESTIAPGTMHDVVVPLLESSSQARLNEGFYLGNCPERVMPGKLLANIRGVSRVVGGMTPDTAEVICLLYRHIVHAELDLSDCITAELVKTVENAYRDVQIAFANEVALICEKVGGDVWRVRRLVNKSPGRMMLMPGAGVGGHCIPKDPWLLASAVSQDGLALQIIPAARATNNAMPLHMLKLLDRALGEHHLDLAGAKILLMGYAYLEDSDDTRNSPSAELAKALKARGADVIVHDPYVNLYQGDVLWKARGCTAAVVMVRHSMYAALDLGALRAAMERGILVDGRAVYTPQAAKEAGFHYWGIGIGNSAGS